MCEDVERGVRMIIKSKDIFNLDLSTLPTICNIVDTILDILLDDCEEEEDDDDDL